MFTSFVLPAIITAAAVLIGGAINAGVQYKTNQENIKATEEANKTNIDLANTSIKRKVDDAVSAGLSPLAAINGPSTSSVVTQPTYNQGLDFSSMISQLSNIGTSVQSSLSSKYSSDRNYSGTTYTADSHSSSSKYSADSLARTANYKTDKDFEIATRKLNQELLMHDRDIAFKYKQLSEMVFLQKEEQIIQNKQLLRQMNETTGELLYKAAQMKNMTENHKLELKRLMLENRKVTKDLQKHSESLSQEKYDTDMKTLTSIFGDLTRVLGATLY